MSGYVAVDLIIKEEDCNLNCEYCLTGQSWYNEEHLMQRIFSPPKVHSCKPGSILYDKLNILIDKIANEEIPVIKVSGGEVFMIQGFVELLIDVISPKFETVVVLTNGLLITPQVLGKLKTVKNLVLQISLDAFQHEGNFYRIPNLKVHNKFIERVVKIFESGIPVEVYSVLNDRSIEYVKDTVNQLLRVDGDIMYYPFPVRGPQIDKYFPRADQLDSLTWLLHNKEKYKSILPSIKYLERLSQYLTNGKRDFQCHLPRIAFSLFEDGTTTSCPNIWFNKVSNMLEEESEEVIRELNNSKFKELLLAKRPKLDACKKCYTPWDSITLFFEDKITLKDLMKCPIYRGTRTVSRIEKLKALYLSNVSQLSYSNLQ